MLRKSTLSTAQKHELLRVTDDFCQVKDIIVRGDIFNVTLKIKFSVLLTEAIKENNNAVVVSVLDGVKDKQVSSVENVDATQKATIANIKSYLKNKSVQNSLKYELLKSSRVDITSKIDNSSLIKIKNGSYANMKLDFIIANSDDDKKAGKNKAFIVSTNQSFLNDKKFDVSEFFNKLIKISSVDPSDVFELDDQSILAYNSTLGTKKQSKSSNISSDLFAEYKSFLLGSNPAASTDDLSAGVKYLKPVVRDVSNDYVNFFKEISLEFDNKSNVFSNVRIKLDLVNLQNFVSTSTKKDIDLMRLINLRYLPKKYPQVKASRGERNVSFSISTEDELTSGVEVFVKKVKDSVKDNDENYELIADLPFNQSGRKHVTWSDPNVGAFRDSALAGVTLIYRFVPYGMNPFMGKISSSLYKNIVINNSESYANFEIPIICLNTEKGVQIITPKLPKNCASINIMRRDITRHEQKYEFVGNSLAEFNNLIDSGVINEHSYEYVCRVNYSSGQQRDVGRKIIKFVKQISSAETKLSIENLKLDRTLNDVQFDIVMQRQNSDQNLLKKILEDQGLLSYFNDEIFEDRTKLEDLLAFRIQRINIKNGNVDSFRVTNNKRFSDLELRSNDNIPPPEEDTRYKYVVDGLFRIPISAIPNLKLSGSVNGQTYLYSPNKYFHPLALKYGIFGDDNSIKFRYAENFMEFGDIGLSTTIDVATSQSANTIQVQNVKTMIIDDHNELISCDVTGPLELIDHFLVIRTCSGTKSIVGRAIPVDGSINTVAELTPDVSLEPRSYSLIAVKK